MIEVDCHWLNWNRHLYREILKWYESQVERWRAAKKRINNEITLNGARLKTIRTLAEQKSRTQKFQKFFFSLGTFLSCVRFVEVVVRKRIIRTDR